MAHVFSEGAYLSIGDPYIKGKKPVKGEERNDPKKWPRHQGRQFTTNPMKKGKPVKNFQSLYEKEKYYDAGYHQRNYQKQLKKKILNGSFKPSSPSKKNSGVGGYYGTLGKKYDHKAEYNVVKRGDKPKKREPEPRNMTTKPSKKGGYGFVGLGISEDYKRGKFVDDYEAAAKKAKAEREIFKKKMKGGAFRAGRSAKNNYFDANPFGVTNLVKETKKKTYEQKKKIDRPFKPSSPSKRGGMIGNYPKYMPDPYVKPKEKKKEEQRAVWRSTGGVKAGPTKSILFNSSRGR